MSARTESIRARLTRWYVAVTTATLIAFAAIVFVFQFVTLKRQIIHDELQDVATVEGLLYIDASGQMRLHQEYFSRPQSHLLIDRLMEVRDLDDRVVYRSPTLHDESLGGKLKPGEGDRDLNEHVARLSDGLHVLTISHIHGIAGKDYVIRLGYSLAPLKARMWQFVWLLAGALILVVALTILIGTVVASRILSPLGQMSADAERISVANLHDRLAIGNPNDELGTLATVFNKLLERLEASFDQLQRFTSDAAHELRAPLASLRAVGEVTLSTPRSAQEYRDAISSLLEESQRLNETVNSLLLLARAEQGRETDVQVFPIAVLIQEVLGLLAVLGEERDIRLEFLDESRMALQVSAERALLRVAVMNVVHNAIKFSPDHGIVFIVLGAQETNGSEIVLTVQDQGPGIEPDSVEKVFDRFYAGSDVRLPKGTGAGLGLAIARLVVRRAGGEIRFDPSSSGAKCVMTLPGVNHSTFARTDAGSLRAGAGSIGEAVRY